MDLFQMVFAGNVQNADAFVAELSAAGYPARIDPLGCGFEPERLVAVVEVLGDGDLGEARYIGMKGRGEFRRASAVEYLPGSPLDIASRHEFALRLHGWVNAAAEVRDPLQTRVDELEELVRELLEEQLMAVLTPPYVLQGGSHPAATFRLIQQAQMGSPTGSFAGGISPTTQGGGHGVCSPTDLVVTQNGTPNMTVNVAAGPAFIRGTESVSQGVYGAYNDATLNLAVAASDPTNPRRDLVVFKVRDAFYSGASNDVSLAIVTGTAAAVPVDPTPPANSLVLYRIAVPAAATTIVNANLTDLRSRAAALGGAVPCYSTGRPTGAALFPGLTIYEIDTTRLYVYDGSGWVLSRWFTPAGRPGVELTDSVQAIGNGAANDIAWSTEVRDVDGWTSGGSATLTVPTGWDHVYAVEFSVTWAGTGLGTQPGIAVLINGVVAHASNGPTPWAVHTVSFNRPLVAGDTIKCQVFQNSGGAINATSRLDITPIGR